MLTRRSRVRLWIVVVFCAIAATACGTAATAGAGRPAAGGGTKTAKVSIKATVTDPGAKPVHWTLRCDPAGGTHPDPAAACRILLGAKNPFAPLPLGMMCPMIRLSSKKATVIGTWFGKPVNLTLSDGGCTLARWVKIGQIFG